MADTPVLFFAPFVSSVLRIEDNGRLGGRWGLGQYHSLIDGALSELLTLIGFDQGYRDSRQSFLALVESHLTCQRPVSPGERLRVTAQLIDCDEERVHLYVELRHATEGWLAVSGECLFAHVDLHSDEPVRFPDPIIGNLMVMRAAHARLPHPQNLGRVIRLQSQSARLN
jgi:acyl-CoA thioester hydrolase